MKTNAWTPLMRAPAVRIEPFARPRLCVIQVLTRPEPNAYEMVHSAHGAL